MRYAIEIALTLCVMLAPVSGLSASSVVATRRGREILTPFMLVTWRCS